MRITASTTFKTDETCSPGARTISWTSLPCAISPAPARRCLDRPLSLPGGAPRASSASMPAWMRFALAITERTVLYPSNERLFMNGLRSKGRQSFRRWMND
jgi:hypothetical protein